jgi:putative lipoprotein
MKKLAVFFCLIFIVLTVVACGAPGPSLERNEWSLDSYGEQDEPEHVLDGTRITMKFDQAKAEVSGSGGCNTYFGSYDIDGSSLSISNLAWTEMACLSPSGVMEQEQEFLSLLADAGSFKIDDDSLTITCSNGKQMHFKIISQ